VLPISYRLIVFDTALLVKKSLNILNQNGELVKHRVQGYELRAVRRHRLRAAVGLQVIHFRRPSHHFGLHQRYPVLLAEPRRAGPGRPVPP
jgi:hypothetical protein